MKCIQLVPWKNYPVRGSHEQNRGSEVPLVQSDLHGNSIPGQLDCFVHWSAKGNEAIQFVRNRLDVS